MAVTIEQVRTRKDLKTFIQFQNDLYKGNPWFVPKIAWDEEATLDPRKNPAYAFSEAALYLAYKDGKLAGRVAAIVNHRANERWNHKEVRFGWIDFIDDREVSKALLDKVMEYGRSKGMETIVGPLGFTDFDAEGMLVEGFDQLCTMALIYNHPYYLEHLEALGFTKEVDWIEYLIHVPDGVPERIARVAGIVRDRYGLNIRKITRKEVKREKLGRKIFDLVNECYHDLYNFTPLPPEMIDKYVDTYLGLLDLKYVTLLEKDHQIVGFGIIMPSIVRALQKSGGKLLPFGWFYLLRSMFFKYEDRVEMLLVGVKPEFKGGLAMLFEEFIPLANKAGFKFAETNAELESNSAMQNPWDLFEKDQTKRRRVYQKSLK
jgi:hypothetical protein